MNVECHMKTAYLNVGCGRRFYKGEPWVNLDIAPSDASVLSWDVLTCFPMAANTFDAVYLSHVLEHFSEAGGIQLVAECHRILKPGGVLRVVVPDLEGICREYLRNLDEIRSPSPAHPDRLTWSKLELLDQCTRHESGGCMRNFFLEHGLDDLDYVIGRIGTVGRELAKRSTSLSDRNKTEQPKPVKFVWWKRGSFRAALLSLLMKRDEVEAMRIGQFRLRGEVHLYMYESVTLEQLFKRSGFAAVEFHCADTSQIMEWPRFGLDRGLDGREHAPSSLYAEGRKHSSI